MKGVEIKFWDNALQEYSKKGWFMVDKDGDVYEVGLCTDSGIMYDGSVEPHIYKDGERVA